MTPQVLQLYLKYLPVFDEVLPTWDVQGQFLSSFVETQMLQCSCAVESVSGKDVLPLSRDTRTR